MLTSVIVIGGGLAEVADELIAGPAGTAYAPTPTATTVLHGGQELRAPEIGRRPSVAWPDGITTCLRIRTISS